MTIQANQGFGVSIFGATSAGGGSTSPGGSSGQLQYNASGSFGGMAGTSWDDTNRALTLTGATVTTSQPVLNLSQTWNAGAVTFKGLVFNATDTASASGSLLLDLQVGGASRLQILKTGNIQGPVTSNFSILAASGYPVILNNGAQVYSDRLRMGSGAFISFTNSDDLILSRAAAASLQLGAADAAAPVAQTLQVQSVVAGTTNTAGANWTLKGSAGTGTGAGGSIIFQVAPAGSSGTAQNAYATALTLNSAQQAVIQSAGTAALPSLTWSGDTTTGFYKSSVTIVDLSIAGTQSFRFSSNGFFFATSAGRIVASSAGTFSFSSGTAGTAGEDVYLYRDAANTLALRNGANAQKLRVYNTYTSATSYENFEIDWQTTANIALVGPTKGSGGGTQRVQRLQYLEDGGTGSTTPSLGTTCPAASATIKSWIKVVTSDGTTAYIPCWA